MIVKNGCHEEFSDSLHLLDIAVIVISGDISNKQECVTTVINKLHSLFVSYFNFNHLPKDKLS